MNWPRIPEHPAAAAPFGPLEQQKKEMTKSDEGFVVKDAALNDIFQYLAKAAGRQYSHNAKIAGSEYLVTGHLNDGNPLQQMEELAFQYGLSLHTKGNTILHAHPSPAQPTAQRRVPLSAPLSPPHRHGADQS